MAVSAIELVRGEKSGAPVLVGLCGSQGSGKSTTADRLAARLKDRGLMTVVLSIDDFYLTHAQRVALGERVHPLLVTRGVPGTHDVTLMQQTIDSLMSARAGSLVALPCFDKLADDRRLEARWKCHSGPVEVVILEGWCVGARPQPESALVEPVNALERDEDGEGVWRAFANRMLRDQYSQIFGKLDLRILLRAPDFAIVAEWRDQQEEALARDGGGARSMDRAAIARFVYHYERLTRWILADEPADLIIDIDRDRMPFAWRL